MRLLGFAAPVAMVLLAPSCEPGCVPGPAPAVNTGVVWHSEVDPARVQDGDAPLEVSDADGVTVSFDMLLTIDRHAAGELSRQCDADIRAATSKPTVTTCLYVQYAVDTSASITTPIAFNLGGRVAEGTFELLGGDREVQISGGQTGVRHSIMHVGAGPDMLVWWSTTVAGTTTVHDYAVPTSTYFEPISFDGPAVGPN